MQHETHFSGKIMHKKYSGETSPRPFSEKLKLSISLDRYSEVFCSLLLL